MNDDIPADLAERCARAALRELGPERGYQYVAEVVLREAGVPEMAEALRQAQAFLFATGYATPVQETVAAALSRYRGEG